MLGAALEELRELQYGVYYTLFLGEHADALRQAGRSEEGLTVIEEARPLRTRRRTLVFS